MRYSARTACLALLALAAAARAAPPQRPPQWIVKGEELGCQLSRVPQQPGEAAFHFGFSPVAREASLIIAVPGLKRDLAKSGSNVQLALEPGGFCTTAVAATLFEARREGRGIAMWKLDPAILQAFATADRLAVEQRGTTLVSVPFTGGDRALKVLRDCNDELMRVWGLDPAVQGRLRQWASPVGGSFVQWSTTDDYPAGAIARAESGTVVVRISVSATGEVLGCETAVSSGSAALDRASCGPIVRRGRFDPALDPHDRPVASKTVTTMHWRIPGGKKAPPPRRVPLDPA